MKKVALIIGLVLALGTQSFACLCSQQIMEAFKKGFQPTIDDINKISNLVQKTIDKVNKGNSLLEEETQVIKKILAVEKENAVDRKEIIFELKRKNSLM